MAIFQRDGQNFKEWYEMNLRVKLINFRKRVLQRDAYWMRRLPLFVSFPRTGSEWLNCVMELYFDRPRLRKGRITFLPQDRADWMWFHDHDPRLKIKHPRVMYLFREPVETIHSNLYYNMTARVQCLIPIPEVRRSSDVDETTVIKFTRLYRRHLEKWLLQQRTAAKLAIRYDRMVRDHEATMEKICLFFGEPYNSERAKHWFAWVTKERMQRQAKLHGGEGIKDHLTAEFYKEDRESFKKKFGGLIREEVLSNGLEEYFNE